MIPISYIAPQRSSRLEVDYYVPIRFRVLPDVRGDNIVGSLGDHCHDIAELKIDRATSELYGFTLVGVGRPVATSTTNPYGALPVQSGIPVIDLKRLTFSEGQDGAPAHFDEPATLSCGLVDDALAVIFDDSAVPTKLVDSREGLFILTGDTLVGFITKPLHSENLGTIRNWIASLNRRFGDVS